MAIDILIMKTLSQRIHIIDELICRHIRSAHSQNRGEVSQIILAALRNFVECIAVKIYSRGEEIDFNYENIQSAVAFLPTRYDTRFLFDFHRNLQISVSHYTNDENGSERLMLKYYEYLLKLKKYVKQNNGLNLLNNINLFPIKTDSAIEAYHRAIAQKISETKLDRIKVTYNDKYYLHKKKPFFVNDEIYYEITFTKAIDNVSKFDRMIAFTKHDILPNYSVRLSISKETIEIDKRVMPIHIIDSWECSIRMCELINYAKIFGIDLKYRRFTNYNNLMRYITGQNISLVDIIDFSDEQFKRFNSIVFTDEKSDEIYKIFSKSRFIIKKKLPGYNILRYLLFSLNNRIIKKQLHEDQCNNLSNLNLNYACIPFDDMPFNTSLKSHNPKISHLLQCIETKGREHELFARKIKNNAEIEGNLYTKVEELEKYKDIDEKIKKYNQTLYFKHTHRKIEKFSNFIYINGYENDVKFVLEKILDLSKSGFDNYSKSVTSWLDSSPMKIDCEEKKNALINMFEASKVSLVYGAAGTGKSTLINHISSFFSEYKKLFLAVTNPAINNLERKVDAPNCTFKTIAKQQVAIDNNYDILIIDECSTVSNSDIRAMLTRINYKLLVLVGDVFQIESIEYGNWFKIARDFVKKNSVVELTKPYRSKSKNLLLLWDRVREMEDNILETLTKYECNRCLDDSIFEKSSEDEIVLCLNYDGLYGINNINSFLQNSNTNTAIEWEAQIYKVGDPIIFNESKRFSPVIYNNLKGKIMKINLQKDKISFDVEVNKVINGLDSMFHDFELVDSPAVDKSVIRFSVSKSKSSDVDEGELDTIVPFQVAYSISVHKAQGLEYDSVKVVITSEVEKMITHNIFYTAITRAKLNLLIYWSPETEKHILENMRIKSNNRDSNLLKNRFFKKA